MRRKLGLKKSQAFIDTLASTSSLFFRTKQWSETFVSEESKSSHGRIGYHSRSIDLPIQCPMGAKGFSPGSNKRVINSLCYSSGTQKERKKKNNLSLAPRYFPEWVAMATGYSNCLQDSKTLAILTRFSASASMYARTYGYQKWCQNWEEDLKFMPESLWVTQDLSRPHRV